MPIHRNVVKACRPRYRAAGGESGPGDGHRPADIPRTDGHRSRPLQPCSDEVKALRALVRTRDDPVAERVALADRLRSPDSRAFYARKRREGKRHHQALIALARRRINVLWAMLHNRQAFQPNFAKAA